MNVCVRNSISYWLVTRMQYSDRLESLFQSLLLCVSLIFIGTDAGLSGSLLNVFSAGEGRLIMFGAQRSDCCILIALLGAFINRGVVGEF